MALDRLPGRPKADVPAGLWTRCPGCSTMVYRKAVEENLCVCPHCELHHRVDARTRVEQVTDTGTFEEFNCDLRSTDPLKWKDKKSYKVRLKESAQSTGVPDAVLTGKGYIKGRPIILAVMEPNFIMGSMGSVVGEKVTSAFERAEAESVPMVAFTCSGGARMMEGMVSLVQMAKTSAAVGRFDKAGGLYIVVMTDPTTAGVAASFAFLGDIILAEPGAMIGFAGPRVIANTIRSELPDGFQRAEFMLEHGFIDRIVRRKDLRSEIARLIDFCGK